MSPVLLNPFGFGPSTPPFPRTNMATTPRANAQNAGAKNELGPSSFNYFHGSYSYQASGGPSDGPATYVRKTLNTSPWPPTDTTMNITNTNIDVTPLSPSINGVDVSPSTDYMFSVWIRASKAHTPELRFHEFRSNGSEESNGVKTLQAISASTWTRVNVLITTTANTGIFTAALRASNGSWANGDTFEWTGMLFEQTNLLGDYFDGTYPNSSWAGTANDSRSTKTA